MDFLNELNKIDEHIPLRQRQELEKISRKSDERLIPYKNTCYKTTGEYFPRLQDRINVILNFYLLSFYLKTMDKIT